MLLSVENAVAVERVGAKAAIDMFVEAGFTGMDYSFFNGGEAWEKAFGGPDALKKAEEIRVYAKEQGLALSQSHAPFKFRFGMEMSENEYEFYRIVRSMEIAAAMEIPAIVVHSIMLDEDACGPEYNACMLDYNERYYNALLPYAERFGIRIAVENLTGRRPPENLPTTENLGTPELFREMQDRLRSPFICGCLDIGHANMTTKDAPGFIRSCKGYVQYIHTHDNDGFHDNHQLPALSYYLDLGRGGPNVPKSSRKPGEYFTIPWDEVLSALREIGYDGPFNLELIRYLNGFRTEDLPLAMKLAVQVGQRMMKEVLPG
ncbi:MAG: sugar phosphate isomerase/epimerase [Lachnospiraceae bacterium]|nr:sugar phosphate isomerase/epimerase [Lachnospiraceae bacterium]